MRKPRPTRAVEPLKNLDTNLRSNSVFKIIRIHIGNTTFVISYADIPKATKTFFETRIQ